MKSNFTSKVPNFLARVPPSVSQKWMWPFPIVIKVNLSIGWNSAANTGSQEVLVSVILCPFSPFCHSHNDIECSLDSSTTHNIFPPSSFENAIQLIPRSKSPFWPIIWSVFKLTESQMRTWGLLSRLRKVYN